jgi:NAD(P)-dependent dehydrogenase (short-subunit alcohol dehydrogenase family)
MGTYVAVNVHAMFYLTKAAIPHMKEGSSIINTASINADAPNPTLLAYATTKGAVQNFTAGLAQLLGAQFRNDVAYPRQGKLTNR